MCVLLQEGGTGGKQLYPTPNDVQTQRMIFFCHAPPAGMWRMCYACAGTRYAPVSGRCQDSFTAMMERRPSASVFLRFPVKACMALATLALALVPADAGRAATADRILLLSTRGLGTRCDAAAMADGMHSERRDESGQWHPLTWSETLAEFADPLPTVIYVHGNRVASGVDKSHGLEFYRWLAARKSAATPMRYVIWSWPSTQIRGRLKDYEVKAARCRPCGWQLAWAIDQLPPDVPLTLVGYSYGARLATGTLHILGGGRLGDLELTERAHPNRPPINVALVAAAVDAAWLRPGGYHGKAISQCASLVLVNNQLDPAMRFYPLSPIGWHRDALGYAGVPGRASLGDLAARIHSVDMTEAVGRHHSLDVYLANSSLGRALGQVIDLPAVTPDIEASSLAGREAGERQ